MCIRDSFAAGMGAYSRSKLANLLHQDELVKRLDGTGVTVNSLHPGFVRTRIGRDDEATPLGEKLVWPLIGRVARTPEKGAETSVYLASAPQLGSVTGRYFIDRETTDPNRHARNDALAAELWGYSAAAVS